MQGLSGVRLGIIFTAVGAAICTISIAFSAEWRLTIIVLLFTPFLIFSGKLQGRKLNNSKTSGDNGKISWAEKGGMVKFIYFFIGK